MNLEELRGRIAIDLKAAMKARAALDVRALRSLLAALDNATAVPLPATAVPRPLPPTGHPFGQAAEVPRRELTPDDIDAILQRELAEREAAIDEYSRLELHEEAERLRQELAILARYRARQSD